MKRLLAVLSALCLVPIHVLAWVNGELLIWMDSDRGYALELIAKKFENDFGLKVTIEAPEKITDSFQIAGAALQIATNGQASAQAALQEAEANIRQK